MAKDKKKPIRYITKVYGHPDYPDIVKIVHHHAYELNGKLYDSKTDEMILEKRS